jgi:hypothetical protein
MNLGAKVGDDCHSCAERWDAARKPRKKLVKLPSTQNKGLMVLVCPYCDGELAITLPKPGN